MNVSNNSSSESSALLRGLNQVSDVIGFYLIPSVSAVGFILNSLTLILLIRSRLTRINTSFYDSIFCKCFTDIVVCLFGTVYMNGVCECIMSSQISKEWSGVYSYEYIFFLSHIAIPSLRVSLLASAYSELALVINRCLVLYNKTTFFSRFTIRGRLSNFFIFAAAPLIPLYMTLMPTKVGDSWYAALTLFAQNDMFKIYILCVFIIENVLPTVLLITFSLVSNAKFNKRVRMNQETGMVGSSEELKKDEVRFSRMIMVIMIVFSVTRSFDLIVGLAFRVIIFTAPSNYEIKVIMNFFRQLAYLFLIAANALNSLIYMAMKSKLRQILPFRRQVQGTPRSQY